MKSLIISIIILNLLFSCEKENMDSDVEQFGYFGNADPHFGDIDPTHKKWFKELKT